MKELFKQAIDLVGDGQTIADEISKYNTDFNGKKMSIKSIQHLIAVLAREYAALYRDMKNKR